MTWSATILRGNDDLDVKPFEPVTSSGMVLVDDGGQAGVTSQIVLRKLADLDTDLGIGILEGAVVKLWNGSAWVDDTPLLSFGAMLVREISCVEHPDSANKWKVEYMSSGFGPLLVPGAGEAAGYAIGSPQISVGVVSRPRMAAAYRAKVTPPVDVVDGNGDFTTTPWRNGVDIAGEKVDINTSPVSIPIDQTLITITRVTRWPWLDWNGEWVDFNAGDAEIGLAQIADEWVGGRNTTAFMGFAIGSLLMESLEVQPLHHEFKTVTMTLIYDEWHHAQQMPLVNPQFNIPTTPDAVTAMSHTTTVLWNQTFLDGWALAEDSGFFGASEWKYLTDVFV